MARLVVTVDGQTAYEGDVDPIILPSRPELYPDVLRPQPGQPPTPLARLMMVTALIEVLRRTAESPMLQPVTVDITTHGPGRATIDIALQGVDSPQ